MHIPSRVEVLSWNENKVADLLREVRDFINSFQKFKHC